MQQLLNLRRRHFVYCFILFLLSTAYYSHFIYLLNIHESKEPKIITWSQLELNISCHYSVENDALPAAEDPNYSPGIKSIFFHETSCRGGINSRQACAIESAARLHPRWQINVMFSAPVSDYMLRKSNLAELLKFKNIKLARVHLDKYGKGTVIEQRLPHYLKRSSHPIEHAADILRMVTLNKFGGMYLDTDSILVRNLDLSVPNWIVKQSANVISTGIMAFSKDGIGALFTESVLREFNYKYEPQAWNYNGVKAIKRVLHRICPNLMKHNGDCLGIRVLPSPFFYPVHYSRHRQYFNNGSIDVVQGVYMHHMWNYLTKDLKIEKDSPYAKIARKFCPTIYKMYGDQFGD